MVAPMLDSALAPALDRSPQPTKDRQTVTPDGEPVAPRIQGLEIRGAQPRMDDRGELIEMFRPSWLFHPEPLVYVYEVVLRPGSIRAWTVHYKQDDRVFVSRGMQRWAFYDDRAESPTRGRLNVFTWSDRERTTKRTAGEDQVDNFPGVGGLCKLLHRRQVEFGGRWPILRDDDDLLVLDPCWRQTFQAGPSRVVT